MIFPRNCAQTSGLIRGAFPGLSCLYSIGDLNLIGNLDSTGEISDDIMTLRRNQVQEAVEAVDRLNIRLRTWYAGRVFNRKSALVK